jgi:hypothetical protein
MLLMASLKMGAPPMTAEARYSKLATRVLAVKLTRKPASSSTAFAVVINVPEDKRKPR